jgi:hypothetical protein
VSDIRSNKTVELEAYFVETDCRRDFNESENDCTSDGPASSWPTGEDWSLETLLFDTTGPLLAKEVPGTDVSAPVSSVESTVGNGRAKITAGACS